MNKVKKAAFSAMVVVGASFVNAAPLVSDVGMSQASSRLVTITYRLANEPGVITVDIQTNAAPEGSAWVSIAAEKKENLLGFVGDVHKVVQPTQGQETRTITWSPDKFWPGSRADMANVRAVVTAWATNAPPDYMVVNLCPPHDVTYYPFKELVPGGVTDRRYKGEYMVFRKIPARGVIWYAGMLPATASYYAEAKRHRVTLTQDYYMGLHEVTISHITSIGDGTPDRYGTYHTPADGGWGSYMDYWRGATKGSQWPTFRGDGSFDYETSHEVDPTSMLGKMRSHHGLDFDIPTEAQWEYAARAGSPGLVYTDTDLRTTAITSGDLAPIARYSGNKQEPDCEGLTGNKAVIGSYAPNAWGLYDMLGNASELCLDWFGSWADQFPDDDKVYVDPVGPASGEKRAYRGYDYSSGGGAGQYAMMIPGRVERHNPDGTDCYSGPGIRLCLPLR